MTKLQGKVAELCEAHDQHNTLIEKHFDVIDRGLCLIAHEISKFHSEETELPDMIVEALNNPPSIN